MRTKLIWQSNFILETTDKTKLLVTFIFVCYTKQVVPNFHWNDIIPT